MEQKKITSKKNALVKKPFQLIFFFLLGAINLSMTRETPDWLLTDVDRQLEEEQSTPALSSGLHEKTSWESFNEWQCFPISAVELTCTQHAFDPDKKPLVWTNVASVLVENSNKLISFDFEEWRNVECNSILGEIKALISEERSLCIYAAYLQELGDNHSYWIPTVLKTAKGYWPNQNFMTHRSTPESGEDLLLH